MPYMPLISQLSAFVPRCTTGPLHPFKGAVKLHKSQDLMALIFEYLHITDGKVANNTAARHLEVKPGSIVVSDRGYFDTRLLNYWDNH